MKDGNKPIVNPFVLLREEFDDWAILFDSDTCRGFGLNPTGVYVWKLLDGEHSVSDLLAELSGQYLDVINTAPEELEEFIQELASYGLAGCGLQEAHDGKSWQLRIWGCRWWPTRSRAPLRETKTRSVHGKHTCSG